MFLDKRREWKEDYKEVGESKGGLGYRIVKKIMCSFEGGYALEGLYFWNFKDVLT